MNKKMREILAKIEEKTKQARAFMDGENKDVSKAAALLDEVDSLKTEYETEKRLYEMEKEESIPEEKKTGESKAKRSEEDALKAFGRAAKTGFKTNDYDGTMNESTPADGGYTVPEDIRTQIETYREATFSFLNLVRRVPVRTATGQRTFKKRAQYTGFSKVGEAGKIGATGAPQFERLSWSIDKYGGFMPITNELRYDSDANVGRVVVEWLANESRQTANNLITAIIFGNGNAINFENLDGIKKALNVDLELFKSTSRVITNSDGLQYLDTLKEKSDSNKYLLTPDPRDPMRMTLTAGASTIPLTIVPNAIMPSTPTYTASADTSVQAGKTYYTESGGVYTKVTSPTGNPSTSGYYEMDPTPQIPFIIGDLYEGVVYWDRQLMSIAESAIAAIGDFNAFEQDLTLYRAIEREDVTTRDTDAFVHGYIQPAAPSGE